MAWLICIALGRGQMLAGLRHLRRVEAQLHQADLDPQTCDVAVVRSFAEQGEGAASQGDRIRDLTLLHGHDLAFQYAAPRAVTEPSSSAVAIARRHIRTAWSRSPPSK